MYFKCIVGSDFERHVIQKFQHLELKISNVQKQLKKILDKLCDTVRVKEEEEKIDIFQHLPLKDEKELETIESKLIDVSFRNEMVNTTTSILKTICLKEGQQFMIIV